jgi:uncharacterized protein
MGCTFLLSVQLGALAPFPGAPPRHQTVEKDSSMKSLAVALLLVLGIGVSAHPAQAAAFNCNYARLPTELLICANEDLSETDEQNATLYYAIRNSLRGNELRNFNARERLWLADRNSCGFDAGCVTTLYQVHIGYLCTMAIPLVTEDDQFEWCYNDVDVSVAR